MKLASIISVSIILRWAKCQELRCNKPDLENGNVQTSKESFKSLEQLRYRCNDGYKPGGELVTTCNQSGWSPVPSCTPILCRKVTIEHGQFHGANRMYSHRETAEYTCDRDFVHSGDRRIHCTAQGWQPNPSCIEITCTRPQINIEIQPFEWRYQLQTDVRYRCRNHRSYQWSRCTRNGWEPSITCRGDPCQRPEIDNAVFPRKAQFHNGETLQVNCAPGFKLQGDATIRCKDGEWLIERSFPACIELGCATPPIIENGDFQPKRARYQQDEVVAYSCLDGYYLHGQSSLRCGSIGWPDPPKCIDPKQECNEMPPPVMDGDILEFVIPPFRPGETLTYQCQDYYILDGNERVICSDGKWSKSPRCLAPCILTQEDFDKNLVPLRWTFKKRIEVQHGDVLEFKCPPGFQVEPPAKRVCQNGKMEIPKCISDDSISCSVLDYFDCPTCARDEICIGYNIQNISMTRPDQSTVSLVAHHGESDASFSLKSNRVTFNVTFSGNINIRFGKTTNPG